MGEYLYGVVKLKKPMTVTLPESGATVTVAHELKFISKPSYNRVTDHMDAKSARALKRLVGPPLKDVYVAHGDTVYLWNGLPYWFDCSPRPATLAR